MLRTLRNLCRLRGICPLLRRLSREMFERASRFLADGELRPEAYGLRRTAYLA
jgi:hypothetical protein